MQSVMAARELNAAQWAKHARIAPTTVSRALDPAYESISSVKTLVALADAIDLPSVLDFLDGQYTAHTHPLPEAQFERVARMVIQRTLRVDDTRAAALSRVLTMVTNSLQPGDSPETEQRVIDIAMAIGR